MGSNQHGKRRTPSFGRSVGMYAGFMLALTVIAMLDAASGGPAAQSASVAQADIETRNGARIVTPRDDPSLPSAAEVIRPAPASSVDAVAPTF